MKFSLIAVTTNRLHLTERLFVSLAGQTCKDFEILFVHGKECGAQALSLAARYADDLNIRVLASADHCLSRSRNTALPLARGEIIAFPDDDCVYEPDTLEHCAMAFEKNPSFSVLSGRVIDLNEMALPSGLRSTRELNRLTVFSHSRSMAQFHKKESVRRVGGFDEDLGVGCATEYQSGEDTDYMLRALECGSRLAYAPAILVRHPEINPRDAGMRAKVRVYAKGRMRLLRKHRMPAWFIMLNVMHPLARIPLDIVQSTLPVIRYRWSMFAARLGGL